jgi:GTP-binding protein Era
LYDVELFTPHSTRDLAAEIIREVCFEELAQEIPYNIAIRIQKFDEDSARMTKIYAEILVSRESHKPIVVGKKASVIKKIGTAARKEIEKMLDTKVYLNLEVSLREDWQDNKRLMKELGYAFDERN